MRECSVLIVEDEVSVRHSLSIVLKATGYKVREAEDGFAALRQMRMEIPDILLSDLNMPGMSGFELLSVVRRRFPAVQVIAMSGTIADVFGGIAADAFHQKGGNLPSLLLKLEKLAEAKGSEPVREGVETPLWIPIVSHDTSGRSIVTLSCPECLRTFPQSFQDVDLLIQDAKCVHCASAVAYAVVRLPAMGSMPQRRLSLVDASSGNN
jgi:CheY-like chemotaxis protein